MKPFRAQVKSVKNTLRLRLLRATNERRGKISKVLSSGAALSGKLAAFCDRVEFELEKANHASAHSVKCRALIKSVRIICGHLTAEPASCSILSEAQARIRQQHLMEKSQIYIDVIAWLIETDRKDADDKARKVIKKDISGLVVESAH